MCRWLAYCGPPTFLDALVFKPENSLIRQSLHALQSRSPTNGDGFGIGWYDRKPETGVFRETLPAWNDQNLRSLCGQIRARLFFGHVRASTGTATARSNCHPFQHGRWLFMHNGAIGGYERLRRRLTLAVPEHYFPCIQGTTDSELLFYLLLGNGLDNDPPGAIGRTLAQLRAIARDAGVDEPLNVTAAVTDGETLYAVRYSSDETAPSLYYGCGARPCLQDGEPDSDMGRAILVLSEPLDHLTTQWTAVPPSHLLIAGDGGVAVRPLELRAAA